MPVLKQEASQDKYGSIKIKQDFIETWEARIALDLLRHFALVAASHTGERGDLCTKGELMPEDEVVMRACNIAEKLTKEFKARDWLIPIAQKE